MQDFMILEKEDGSIVIRKSTENLQTIGIILILMLVGFGFDQFFFKFKLTNNLFDVVFTGILVGFGLHFLNIRKFDLVIVKDGFITFRRKILFFKIEKTFCLDEIERIMKPETRFWEFEEYYIGIRMHNGTIERIKIKNLCFSRVPELVGILNKLKINIKDNALQFQPMLKLKIVLYGFYIIIFAFFIFLLFFSPNL